MPDFAIYDCFISILTEILNGIETRMLRDVMQCV